MMYLSQVDVCVIYIYIYIAHLFICTYVHILQPYHETEYVVVNIDVIGIYIYNTWCEENMHHDCIMKLYNIYIYMYLGFKEITYHAMKYCIYMSCIAHRNVVASTSNLHIFDTCMVFQKP